MTILHLHFKFYRHQNSDRNKSIISLYGPETHQDGSLSCVFKHDPSYFRVHIVLPDTSENFGFQFDFFSIDCLNCEKIISHTIVSGIKFKILFEVSRTLCNYYFNVYCLWTFFCYFTICKIKCAALIN